jgi:hypothetical protein
MTERERIGNGIIFLEVARMREEIRVAKYSKRSGKRKFLGQPLSQL